MSPASATLIGAGVVVLINLLTAAFVYGRLTEKVRGLENTVSGPGGHGERITRLESPQFARKHQHGD